MEVDHVTLPENLACHFRCSLCQCYLSVAPVMTTSETENSFKCGRCHFIESDHKIKAVGYEKLAAFMTFPCSYENCIAQVKWGHVEQHENVCAYRIVTCPCYHCESTYEMQKIISHFKEHHESYMCLNECTILNRNIKSPNRCLMRLLVSNGKPYLMFNYRDTVHFWFSIYSVNDFNKNTTYRIEFFSLNGKYSVTVNEDKIVPFNERQHCINCLDRDCQLKFHKYSKLYKDGDRIYGHMTTKIKIDDVVNMLGCHTVNYTVRIIQKLQEEDAEKTTNVQRNVVLQNLECQVCKGYMSAPIYNCKTGHTICKVCRPKLIKCPSCTSEMTDTRCFPLEDIADKITVNCRNKCRGCYFTGNIDQLEAHEKICNVIF